MKSIYEIQQLIKSEKVQEAGAILSSKASTGDEFGIWYDWFCHDKSLPREASKLVTFIKGLKGNYIHTHYLWFKNNCPMTGALYTDVRISPMKGTYNIGYSLGNGTSRDREVFDTRQEIGIKTIQVKNNKEAFKVVNDLLQETLDDVLGELNKEVEHMKDLSIDDIMYDIENENGDALFMGSDGTMQLGEYLPEQLKNMKVLKCYLSHAIFHVTIKFDESKLFKVGEE